jgi:hypothetical protein
VEAQIYVSITYVGETTEAQALVDGWGVPEGAQVAITASETIHQGTVDESGQVVPSPALPTDEAP